MNAWWWPLALYGSATGGFALGVIAAAVLSMAANHPKRKGNPDEQE